jgi:hypothetical protein
VPSDRPDITVGPDDAALARALATAGPPPPDARRFREELALPVDRPLVMTGHQAQFWHPGILAKLLASHAAALPRRAAVAWLTVDQDDNDPWTVRYPRVDTSTAASGSTVSAGEWRADPAPRQALADAPNARRPAITPRELPIDPAMPAGVRTGLESIHDALARHAAAASAAEQIAAALADLLAPLVPSTTLHVPATRISTTSAWRAWVDAMARDPLRVARAYNAAVRERPAADVRPLAEDGPQGPELPLWHIAPGPGSPRRRVFAGMLARTPAEQLVPKALAMTGLVRSLGCDVFVHGLGGGVYDTITERWLGEWLGVTLAPTVVVSATLRLDLGVAPVSLAEIDKAAWTAHRARHDPALLGDHDAERRKQALLIAMRGAVDKPRKTALYAELHRLLAGVREARAARIDELRQEAEAWRPRRGEAAVLADRTWAFPLYAPSQLADLAQALRDRVG